MKKALQISIGGAVFTIEDDAYTRLDDYISSIKKHFEGTSGSDEIIRDIESRIAEQLAETGRAAITAADVESVITSMGSIKDFGGEESDAAEARTETRPKKLYRSSEDVVIAGVCSGLAAYFGIDALWVRIAFIILAFSTGLTIIAYIVLWIIMPEAKTPAQKLEMSGSPVTIETLSESVKEKVEEVREKHGSRVKDILRAPFVFAGHVVRFIRRRIFPLIRVIVGVILAATSLIGILALSFVAPLLLIDADKYAGLPLSEITSNSLIAVTVVGAYFALVIPLATLFILSIDIMRRKTVMTAGIALALLFLWCAALVSGSVSGFMSAERIDSYTRTHELYEKSVKEMPVSAATKNVRVENGMRLTFVQGADAALTVSGQTKSLESARILEEGDAIVIRRDRPSSFCIFCPSAPIEATLTLPSLESLSAGNGSRADVRSLTSSSKVSFSFDNGSRGILSVTAPEITIEARNGSRVDASGAAATGTIVASYGSSVDATSLSLTQMVTDATYGSSIELP